MDNYQTAFRIDNFQASYTNRISTEPLSPKLNQTGTVEIEQDIRHREGKLHKTTRLRVGDQIILINDIFEYTDQQPSRIEAVGQFIDISEGKKGHTQGRSRVERRGRCAISKKVVQHFVEWLRKNTQSALKRMFHAHRKELSHLLAMEDVNFNHLEGLLVNREFRRVLLEFLRGFNISWQMNLTATTPIA